MGVDYNAYVGPYIKVHNPLRDVSEKYHTCSNPKCDNHKKDVSTVYCCLCGKKVGTMTRPTQERIEFDYWDKFGGTLAEAFGDEMPDDVDEYQFFVPNTGNIGSHLDVGYNTIVKPIDCGAPGMDIDNFQLAFKEQIAGMKKVFGKNAVTIEWGVLVWQS